MTAILQQVRRAFRWREAPAAPAATLTAQSPPDPNAVRELDLSARDALVAYLHTAPGVIDLASLRLDSPLLARLRAEGTRLIVPLLTCLYAVLDPATGRLQFANAGHDVAYWRTAAGALHELRARGMPLGLMEGMVYEEHEVRLGAGDHLLLYSDGLVEAHSPRREMFSFERLAALVAGAPVSGQPLITRLLNELARFTGPGWVQEDDITLVTLECLSLPESLRPEPREAVMAHTAEPGGGWQTLAELLIPSAPDNERLAMEQVAAAVEGLALPPPRLERLKTAVAEATMNAMEHGNGYRADQPTRIAVRRSATTLSVRIFDHGAGPAEEPDAPDLELKLDGLQSPRGWGLHLIRHMVNELRESHEDGRHVVDLVVRL